MSVKKLFRNFSPCATKALPPQAGHHVGAVRLIYCYSEPDSEAGVRHRASEVKDAAGGDGLCFDFH